MNLDVFDLGSLNVKVVITLVCAFLGLLGGIGKPFPAALRKVGIPLVLGAYFALYKAFWLFPIVFICSSIIRLPYGNYSPEDDDKPNWLALLTKDRVGARIRAIYGFLVSSISALPFIYMGLTVPLYVSYIVFNTFVGYVVSKYKFVSWLAEGCVYGALGSIVFFMGR